METRATRIGLGVWAALVVLFLYFPIALIVVYAFNKSNIQSWPIPGFTTRWFSQAWHDRAMRDALELSLKAAGSAMLIALLLGSAAAFAVGRYRFFGRETVSFLLVLPLALPGIITGMALNSFFTFALTLGDYITPILVGGGPGSKFIGNVVYENVGVANNVPFAAAYATIPVLVMAIYLVIAKRLGAFEAL